MKFRKATEKLPSISSGQLFLKINGTRRDIGYYNFTDKLWWVKGDCYTNEQVEWLDESALTEPQTPLMTLDECKDKAVAEVTNGQYATFDLLWNYVGTLVGLHVVPIIYDRAMELHAQQFQPNLSLPGDEEIKIKFSADVMPGVFQEDRINGAIEMRDLIQKQINRGK